MADAQNRRRYPRYPLDMPMVCDARGECQTVQSVNISEGGLLVASPHSLGVGSKVTLKFHLGNAGEFSLQGTVKHAVEEHHGTEFIELSADDQKRLRDYVKQAAADALSRL
jgi:hypothetical protein